MRNLIIAATAAAAVGFVLPAAAQNNGTWNGGQFNQEQGASQGQMLQQKIQQDLSQAGFTDIHVMPRSFVVSAKDHDGNPVELMITPHSLTAFTAMPQHNEYGQNGNGWNHNRGNWNNGYSQNGSMGDNGQSYRQSENGPMGDNGMSNSAHSGSMINSPNGNGSYSR